MFIFGMAKTNINKKGNNTNNMVDDNKSVTFLTPIRLTNPSEIGRTYNMKGDKMRKVSSFLVVEKLE